MTEVSESTSSNSTAPHKGVKKGLPADGLAAAEAAAKSLWDVARLGLTSDKSFADKLGRKSASGGSWRTLMALLRGFGLIREDGEQLGLSEVGQALVNDSDPSRQLAARRTALLNLKAYRELVQAFDGTELPETTTLASRLKFDYGKSDEFAGRAAQAFVDSLRHAGMVDASGHVSSSGVTATSVPKQVAPEPRTDEDRQADEIDEAFSQGAEDEDAPAPEEVSVHAEADAATGAFETIAGAGANVSISVTLDLSKYRADEVIQILKVLNG